MITDDRLWQLENPPDMSELPYWITEKEYRELLAAAKVGNAVAEFVKKALFPE